MYQQLFSTSLLFVLASSAAAQSVAPLRNSPQPVRPTDTRQSQAQQPTGRNPVAQSATSPQPTASQPAESAKSTARAEIAWLRSATEAAKLSQETGKPILVYVRSKNCYYCDLLQQNTWQDPAIKAQVMRDMIPLKLTLEENKEAVETMKVKGFPSVIVFSPRREYLSRIDGYVTPTQFQSRIEQALIAGRPQATASSLSR
jgi:thioredoxin-related protein